MSSHSETAPAVKVSGLSKAYGPTLANSDVSFSVAAGTVHALLGENGAGKSTTMKLLSGLIRPDSGTICIQGQTYTPKHSRDAHACGVETAFQELTLVSDLTVLENMLLPSAPWTPFATLNRGLVRCEVARHFDSLGMSVDQNALAGAS